MPKTYITLKEALKSHKASIQILDERKEYARELVRTGDDDLENRLERAEKEIEELKAEIHRKSVKYSSRRETDEKIKADYRNEIKRAYHALLFDETERAKTILANAIGDDQ